MIVSMYSIRDIKNDFAMPFVASNDATAVRMYKASAADKNSTLAIFPADFELWHVCKFNTSNAMVEGNAYPIALDGDNNA